MPESSSCHARYCVSDRSTQATPTQPPILKSEAVQSPAHHRPVLRLRPANLRLDGLVSTSAPGRTGSHSKRIGHNVESNTLLSTISGIFHARAFHLTVEFVNSAIVARNLPWASSCHEKFIRL